VQRRTNRQPAYTGKVQESPKPPPLPFSKLIVSLIIVLNVVFTAIVLLIFYKVGSEPYALVGAWFAFTGTELWALSKIKRDEIKKEDEGND